MLYFYLEVMNLDHSYERIGHSDMLRSGWILTISTFQADVTDVRPESLWVVLAIRWRGLKLSHVSARTFVRKSKTVCSLPRSSQSNLKRR